MSYLSVDCFFLRYKLTCGSLHQAQLPLLRPTPATETRHCRWMSASRPDGRICSVGWQSSSCRVSCCLLNM